MTILIAGQTLNEQRQPIEGTGFEYDSNGRLAQLLNQRTSPILSRPFAGEWFFEVNSQSNGSKRPVERVVAISRAGNAGPPEHIHPSFDEYVEVVRGEFIVGLRTGDQKHATGDKFIIEKGIPHTVRAVGDSYAAAIVEIRPAALFGTTLRNFCGLDHDGQLSPEGQPKFLQAMVFGSTFVNDSVFTTPPPAIGVPVAKALTPLAKLAGYQGRYARYEDDAFWLKRVAQPELQLA